MPNMKIIQGARRELEYELLAALFTPGADASAEALKQRLARRGANQLRAVNASPSPSSSAPLSPSESVEDQD